LNIFELQWVGERPYESTDQPAMLLAQTNL